MGNSIFVFQFNTLSNTVNKVKVKGVTSTILLFLVLSIQTFAQSKVTNNEITSDSFENGFGNWNDGGIDCAISSDHSSSGIYSVKLKDNSQQASSIYSNPMQLKGIDLVTINFKFHCYSMEINESFVLEISTDGGKTFKIYEQYVSGIDFENDQFYSKSLVVKYEFSNTTIFRFRCLASSNNDHVYLDQIEVLEGKENYAYKKIILTDPLKSTTNNKEDNSSTEIIKLFPNPASNVVSIDLSTAEGKKGSIEIYNLLGSKLSRTIFKENHPKIMELPVDYLENGYYSVCVKTNNDRLHVMRLMVSR